MRRPRDFFSVGLDFARSDVGAQTLVEVIYLLRATGWLTIQCDVQLLRARDAAESVLGVRAKVELLIERGRAPSSTGTHSRFCCSQPPS